MATLEMNVRQVNSDFQAIKNKLVEKGVNVADGTKTSEYASKVNEVYEAGKQAEHTAFWNAFQDYGNRTAWRCGCAGPGWDDNTFKPIYPFVVADGYMMFANSRITHIPVAFDSSGAISLQYCFQNCVMLLELPTIQAGTIALYGTFNGCASLHTIEKIVPRPENKQANNEFTNTFRDCVSLVDVIFEGIIAQPIDFSACVNLSKASFENIMGCLSTTTSGMSVTFSKAAKEAAFTADEWAALIAAKPNWTINLV